MLAYTLFAALVIRLISLGLYPLTDPSEGRYAEIGRHILEYGDWVTPWLDKGEPFWGKPPLSFWMTATSLQTLGESAFAARLPHFIAGLLTLWVIYDLLKRANLPKAAMYCVAMTAGSVIFYISSGSVITDEALALGCAVTMRGFWLALNGPGDRRNRECYLAFAGLGLGLLAKGPLVLVLSLIPIGLWATYTRNLKTVLIQLPWVRGVFLMLAIGLPWYLLAEFRTPGFIEYFIVGEHWQRYLQKGWTGDLYGAGRAKPLGMIWIYGLISLLPWTILLPVLAWMTRKTPQDRPLKLEHQMMLYFAVWGIFPLIFFSLARNVLIAYTLPAIAPLCCLAGIWLSTKQADKIISRTLMAGLLCTAILSLAAVTYIHFSNLHNQISTQTLIENWQANAKQSEPLYFFMKAPYSSKFYSDGKVRVFKNMSDIEQATRSSQPIFLALEDKQLKVMPESLKSKLQNPQPFGHYTLFELGGLHNGGAR